MHLNNYKVDTSTPSHHQVFVAKENTFQNFEKFVGFEMARSKRMNYQKICTSTPHISFIPSNIITEYDFRSGEFLIPITDVEVWPSPSWSICAPFLQKKLLHFYLQLFWKVAVLSFFETPFFWKTIFIATLSSQFSKFPWFLRNSVFSLKWRFSEMNLGRPPKFFGDSCPPASNVLLHF